MIILRLFKVLIGGGPVQGVKPPAPAVIADDANNTLQFTASGAMEISVANGPWTDYTGYVIAVGDDNFSVNRWRCRVKAEGVNPASNIVGSPTFTKSNTPIVYDYEKYINNAYVVANARTASNAQAVNGDFVHTIPDTIGTNHLIYTGDASPSLERPKYLDGAVCILNQPDAAFASAEVAYNSAISTNGLYNLPEEKTIVLRRMPGTPFEAISGYTGDYYIGFAGDTGEIRLGGSPLWVIGSQAPALFKISVIHVLYEHITGNTFDCTLWVDGVLQGTVRSTDGIYRRNKAALSVHTNAADHDVYAEYYKNGKMSNADRADYLSQLNSRFNVGQLPVANKPYASNVGMTKAIVGGIPQFTATYSYNGGNSENVGAVQYQWYELINPPSGKFQHVPLGTTKTISYSGSNMIRPTVKVSDNQGNTWRYVNGQFTNP